MRTAGMLLTLAVLTRNVHARARPRRIAKQMTQRSKHNLHAIDKHMLLPPWHVSRISMIRGTWVRTSLHGPRERPSLSASKASGSTA